MLASTDMVTVGGVADHPGIDRTRRQTTPKILESFMVEAPVGVELKPTSLDRIYDYSSP